MSDSKYFRNNYSELFDEQSGIQSSIVYTSEYLFEKELSHIFAKSWLFLGHESQISAVGDYMLTRMANDSIILTRQRNGGIAAMLNQCRHRGVQLCKADHGNARSFTCSYHGWCFDTAGKLLTMPHEQRVYGGQLDKESWGLNRVPRVETYKGLIFGSWDAEIESLSDYLGDAKWYLDAYLDRSEAGSEIIGLQKWRLKANWKWGAEQHASDFYHAQVSHVSFLGASVPGATINRLVADGPEERGLQFSLPERGHGGGWMVYPDEATLGELFRAHEPVVVDWLRNHAFPKWSQRLGGNSRTTEMTVSHLNIFPNMSLNKAQGYIRLYNPVSPSETEVWSFLLVDRDAPQEIKDAYLREMALTFSAAGGLEQDDAENAILAQRGVSGFMASKTALNLQMGKQIDPVDELKGGPGADFDGPGRLSTEYSEQALRGFYQRYAELMSANQ